MAATGDGDRILRDVNGNMSDHLQNHIHLTNCIHLKNHLHKQSPFPADRTLLRELVVLQKSRRLRDPLHSQRSPSLADDLILQRREKDASASRRFENCSGECARMSGSDPPMSRATSGLDDRRRTRREESSRKILENGVTNWGNDMANYVVSVSERFEMRDKSVNRKEEALCNDDAALSCNRRGRKAKVEKNGEEAAKNMNSHGKNTKEKRHRFRSARRNRPCLSIPDAKARRPQMSAATGSFLQENNDQNCRGNDANKCGIPFNWSRIHDRGKSFLGRSLSRGLSESRSRKEGAISDNSSSSMLLDVSGSQKSMDRFPRIHDYSGELSIFADKQETDSDLSSQGHRVQRQHQNLTQKYMPRTFNDLVGQNLVVKALSNAVMKRKIGFLYVFYGPHGTGKTACARIFARALNCQSSESSKPCGFCDSCIAHGKGKSRNIREIGPIHSIDYEGVLELFENGNGVFIFDECDAMASECWSALLKVIYGAPRRVVIILVCSSLDVLPHVMVSRSQKFCFTKVKEADIVYALQIIARKEDLAIDKDALKLIASRSNGSLRDAEMTLEQLSLLGQNISLCLVQELIGLISDEKLLDLLDFALSADTINTVKNLRDIMASGVEPLALMSQLATIITDILAGSNDNAKERHKRKFFHHQTLSKEDMEKLRQALKTLSEAEKQLRVSSERMTWLTAALLQLAPHQHYTDTSSDHKGNDDEDDTSKISVAADKLHKGIEEIWLEVLENIKVKSLKEFMHKEGRMASMSYGAAPTVQLVFNSQLTKSVVEKFRSHILQAFEAVLGSSVTIEIRQGPREESGAGRILLRGMELSGSDEIARVEAESQSESGIFKYNGSAIGGKTFDERELSEREHSLSIVRRRISLAHVLQHQHQEVSNADNKLEEENLKLEPSSRRLLCWNQSRITHPKLSCLNVRRKPHSIRKFVCCGRCARSPK